MLEREPGLLQPPLRLPSLSRTDDIGPRRRQPLNGPDCPILKIPLADEDNETAHPQGETNATATTSNRTVEDGRKSQTGTGTGTETETETEVKRTLRRVGELQQRVSSENQKIVKQEIIAQYPDLRELLEYIYNPDHRTHITWSSLSKYIEAQDLSLYPAEDKDGNNFYGRGKSIPKRSRSASSSSPSPNPSLSFTSGPKATPTPTPMPKTLIELFDMLSEKTVTGNLAKETILQFLVQNGVIVHKAKESQGPTDNGDGQDKQEQQLVDVFGRLLDRNLIAGFGAKTLRDVRWSKGGGARSPKADAAGSTNSPKVPRSAVSSSSSPSSRASEMSREQSEAHVRSDLGTDLNPNAKSSAIDGKTPLHPKLAPLDKFEVALGKSIDPPFDVLFKDGDMATWYASRKLDGVRCLTFLDFLVPSSSVPAQPTAGKEESSPAPEIDLKQIQLVSIHFVSRTGKPFCSLSKLEAQLAPLADLPELHEWLDADHLTVERRDEGLVKRLILDGEVCVMRPKDAAEKEAVQPRDDGTESVFTATSRAESLPASHLQAGTSADAIWISNDPFVEDFSSTVSLMRRTDTIEHLSYFIFDILSYSQVNTKGVTSAMTVVDKSSSESPHAPRNQDAQLNPKFSERIKRARRLVSWLNSELERQGVQEKMIKDLKQIKIGSVQEVEGMVGRAAEEGWEGLVFRKDDGYKGKRSPDVRKFKKWQDSEYIVESIDTSSMRLSVNGVYGTYEALSNVWISHEGHRVSVGSGFTADQRIRYAKDSEGPDGIVGKMITVEYFSESVAANRNRSKSKSKGSVTNGDGGKSLRFPRVKMVWEEGKRGM
ncbi:hypothetical protein IAU59_003465 [Kwoniella sp. CBS 9459]